MELKDAIFTRRSVRKFTDYNVTDDEIKEIIEAGRYAPSWKNLQTWEFVVLRDKKIIADVAETIRIGNPSRECAKNVSAMIIVCARKDESGLIDGEKITKFNEWFMFDAALSVQNMCLRIHDLGLGTVIVGTVGHEKTKKILNIPENMEVVVALPIGKPAYEPKEKPRKELNDFVHIDKFGNYFKKD